MAILGPPSSALSHPFLLVLTSLLEDLVFGSGSLDFNNLWLKQVNWTSRKLNILQRD